MRSKRFPKYPDDTDYTTNSPSYYDDLARKNKLIQLLTEKIWEYEETLDLTLEEITNRLESYIEDNDNLMTERLEQWDLNLEKFPENVELLLQEWLSDGTLDHIINDTIFNWKADKTYVDSEIERLEQKDENLTAQLAQTVKEIANVKFYGAVGDGVADDTIPIQTAIDEIHAQGGGTVWLPVGTYRITNSIVLKSHVDITGEGMQWPDLNVGSRIKADPYVNAIYTGFSEGDSANVNNVKLSNFTLAGSQSDEDGTNETKGLFGWNLRYNVIIERVQISGFSGAAIDLYNNWFMSIRDCRISHNDGIGIRMTHLANRVSINQSMINQNGIGLSLRNYENVSITENLIEKNELYGVATYGGQVVSLVGNYMELNGSWPMRFYGDEDTPDHNVLVERNRIQGNSTATLSPTGIFVRQFVQNYRITDNFINGFSDEGIYVERATKPIDGYIGTNSYTNVGARITQGESHRPYGPIVQLGRDLDLSNRRVDNMVLTPRSSSFRPANATVGQIMYDVSLKQLLSFDGTDWRNGKNEIV